MKYAKQDSKLSSFIQTKIQEIEFSVRDWVKEYDELHPKVQTLESQLDVNFKIDRNIRNDFIKLVCQKLNILWGNW